MTYTILGYCEKTGALGIGIATYSVAVGGLCPAIRSNAGVVTSQAFVNPELRPLGTNLLSAGHSAKQTLALLLKDEEFPEYRQIGVMDREGRSAVFTGSAARGWAGYHAGNGYVALGNVLKSEAVVESMGQAFRRSDGKPLAHRLLLALEAGRDAGGQLGSKERLPERSASLRVHGRSDVADIDLRTDMHPQAVDDLRRIYDCFQPYIAFNKKRWLEPFAALPQEVFVEQLERNSAGQS